MESLMIEKYEVLAAILVRIIFLTLLQIDVMQLTVRCNKFWKLLWSYSAESTVRLEIITAEV